MSNKPAIRDGVLARIAGRQHGVVTARQLARVGLSRAAISARVKAGRLHRVHRGVYAVGHERLTLEGRCMAAFLACCSDPAADGGPGAAVSHISAARLWDMLPAGEGHIHLSVLTAGGRAKRPDIVIHRPPSLCSSDLTQRSGIWVTKPARTLLDLARVVKPALHQKATRRALDLRLVSEEALTREPDLTRSELERMFLRLCRRHRLAVPEVNARIVVRPRNRTPVAYEVDFLWREARLIVETDGFKHHGHREAFEADRARDAALQGLGFRVLRFTYRQVEESPHDVAVTLRTVLEDSWAA